MFAHERIASEAARRLPTLQLDFTPASLASLDLHIDQASQGEPPDENTLLLLGSYLGETVRKRLGGEWNDQLQGDDIGKRIQLFLPGDIECHPLAVVRDRLLRAEGAARCLDFFEALRFRANRGEDTAADAPAWLRAAEALRAASHTADALKLARRATVLAPEAAQAWLVRGELEEQQGQLEQALGAFRHAHGFARQPQRDELALRIETLEARIPPALIEVNESRDSLLELIPELSGPNTRPPADGSSGPPTEPPAPASLPATEPPATEPPADEPPATEPPATEPPAPGPAPVLPPQPRPFKLEDAPATRPMEYRLDAVQPAADALPPTPTLAELAEREPATPAEIAPSTPVILPAPIVPAMTSEQLLAEIHSTAITRPAIPIISAGAPGVSIDGAVAPAPTVDDDEPPATQPPRPEPAAPAVAVAAPPAPTPSSDNRPASSGARSVYNMRPFPTQRPPRPSGQTPSISPRPPIASLRPPPAAASDADEVVTDTLGQSIIEMAKGGDVDFVDALLDESVNDWETSIEPELIGWLTTTSDNASTDEKRAACGAAMLLADRKGFRPGAREAEAEASLRLLEKTSLLLGASLPPVPRAKLMLALAAAYSDRLGGNNEHNQKEALQVVEGTLFTLDARAQPELWARAHRLLGNIHRKRGQRKEHVEAAVGAFRAALRALPPGTAELWAPVQIDLGNALRARLTGDRNENNEGAIECFVSALAVLSRDEYPLDWALGKLALGQALLERNVADRSASAERAIATLNEALEELPGDSVEAAQAHYRLGLALQRRKTGERADNLKQAIGHYEKSIGHLPLDEDQSAHENMIAARRELARMR